MQGAGLQLGTSHVTNCLCCYNCGYATEHLTHQCTNTSPKPTHAFQKNNIKTLYGKWLLAGHVARMVRLRISYKFLVGEHQEKTQSI